ncbi:PTS sugar transporter subunit IIB [Erysipelothrix inopinata]|uniref:PTS sugar transporter subunit IIB n=1 Tax=Erysipelothrix inopinata TaxID=225084 RepID=A0A7G9S0N6_9FIRM|nr:PTS sugar transporter subunit IIB [Erysipelothrix inopinata]QNN61411.1 PTS sugar transporter subunit IIB [Erysipelothrix inopinata]
MKRVYLFCNAGMSTSLLASKMQTVADAHKLPIEVKAFSDSKMDAIVQEFHPDVILLGPQIKYKFEETKAKYGDTGVPIEVIDLEDYGKVDGERVLKKAIMLIKGKGE